jgi:hypothetical protein
MTCKGFIIWRAKHVSDGSREANKHTRLSVGVLVDESNGTAVPLGVRFIEVVRKVDEVLAR